MNILGPWIYNENGYWSRDRLDNNNLNPCFEISLTRIGLWHVYISGYYKPFLYYDKLESAQSFVNEYFTNLGYILVDDTEQWNKIKVLL